MLTIHFFMRIIVGAYSISAQLTAIRYTGGYGIRPYKKFLINCKKIVNSDHKITIHYSLFTIH